MLHIQSEEVNISASSAAIYERLILPALVDQTPHHQIVWKSAEGSAITFSLTLKLEDQDAACLAQLHCDADVNAFMEMMVKAPLKSLFDNMAKKLQRQYAPGA